MSPAGSSAPTRLPRFNTFWVARSGEHVGRLARTRRGRARAECCRRLAPNVDQSIYSAARTSSVTRMANQNASGLKTRTVIQPGQGGNALPICPASPSQRQAPHHRVRSFAAAHPRRRRRRPSKLPQQSHTGFRRDILAYDTDQRQMDHDWRTAVQPGDDARLCRWRDASSFPAAKSAPAFARIKCGPRSAE